MATALLYLATSALTLYLAHRIVVRLGLRPSAALILLPLCFTGKALLTGRVYAPIDLPMMAEPFRNMREAHGIEKGHNATLSDVYCLNIPWKKAVRVALGRGELPLWNPFVFSGDILAASAQPTPYDPYFLLSLLLPMANSLTFLATITFFLAGLCMYLYAREVECGEVPSLFGAVVWMYGSFLVFWLEWVITVSLLWLPLVFLGVRRIIRGGARGVAILTAGFVMMLVSGHPETALHVVFIGIFYALFELYDAGLLARWREVVPIAGKGIGAGVLALLLTAIYLAPILEALPQTVEHSFREGYFALQDRSAPLDQVAANLTRNFIPFRYGTPPNEHDENAPIYPIPDTSYPGSVAFAPALFALWRSRWRGRWFYLGLAVFGYWAGPEAPPVADLLAKLPLFDIALNKRLIFCALFAIAVLGALGLETLLRESGSNRRLALVMLAATALLGAGVAMAWPDMRATLDPVYLRSHILKFLIPPLLAGVALLVIRSPRIAGVLLVAMLLAQRTAEMSDFYPTLEARAFYPPVPEFALMERSEEPYRIVGLGHSFVPNTATMYELEDVRGYQAMTNRRLFDTISIWSIYQPVWFNRVADLTRPFLSMMNVRYAIAPPNTAAPEGWTTVVNNRRMTLLENRHVHPRAYVPRTVRINASHPLAIAEMGTQRDFWERSWIEHPEGGAPPGEIPNGPGLVTTTAPKMGTRILDVRLLKPGWVVVSETGWRGWKAYSGGRRIPLRFANHAFLGMYLPAGRHRVELVYWPRSFVFGAIVTGLTIAGLLAYPFAARRRKRWPRPPAAPAHP